MTREHRKARARRVVVGIDGDGRSTIVSDGPTPTHLATDAYTLNQIWQATQVPTPVMAENTLGDDAVIPPPPGGYTYVVTTFPPDNEWDYTAGWTQALIDAGAADSVVGDSGVPGMHATDTVDILTIISGEIYAVLETGETLLRPGDSLVQRGTKHAWRNRGDVACVMAAIHISGVR